MAQRNIKVRSDKIAEFCRQQHIIKLSFFGSALRDDFARTSDIDVLVEFEPGYVPGLFRLARRARGPSALLENRKVDLRTPQDLSRYFRDEVIATAEVQYAR
jgi:predicted nucleotidyltransferase